VQFGLLAAEMPQGGVKPRYKLPVTTVILVDIDKKVQAHMVYPSTVGRNFYEPLRCLDSLQLTLYHQVATHHISVASYHHHIFVAS
jgi:alkyl hydroperoxide reductase subunit AhpC